MSVQLTYTEKGKKPRKEVFRSYGDAQEHLTKLQQMFIITASEIKEMGPYAQK